MSVIFKTVISMILNLKLTCPKGKLYQIVPPSKNKETVYHHASQLRFLLPNEYLKIPWLTHPMGLASDCLSHHFNSHF
jgi:hypothetical protein